MNTLIKMSFKHISPKRSAYDKNSMEFLSWALLFGDICLKDILISVFILILVNFNRAIAHKLTC